MRFAHLADTHLGFKHLGLDEREEDLYETFSKTIDKIIELDVDFVIHSGDLFNSAKPTTNTLLVFQKELFKLNDAGIPFYVIAGNHDSLFLHCGEIKYVSAITKIILFFMRYAEKSGLIPALYTLLFHTRWIRSERYLELTRLKYYRN